MSLVYNVQSAALKICNYSVSDAFQALFLSLLIFSLMCSCAEGSAGSVS